MVVLAASICTRGGKAVLSRQFREMPRTRIEALLASFPKLADSGTQHTIVEQDNVRFVYQPLDELYIVLITNRQSNILQDIDSLHIFAQVVSSICKSLDEREIVRSAFELLSAFDEIVTLGYRENLSLSQIKTFLEMESHEERVQEIIDRNKELEATEERKRKAKQLEMQRKEAARSGRAMAPRTPSYPTYTPPVRSSVPDAMDSYEAEKKKTFSKVTSIAHSDTSFTKAKLDLTANATHGAQYRTHPNVDKALFSNQKVIQLKDTSKRFPANNAIGVLRWRIASSGETDLLPITFTVWVNKGSDSTTVTVEYELTGSDSLQDVAVTIPFQTVEPTITSFDSNYEVTGDTLDWNIGHVDTSNSSGSFEFESSDPESDENEFFPMNVRFTKSTPFADVDVLSVSLLDMEGESVGFTQDVKCVADGYTIE
ncbi:coatomer subunit delta [Trichophyton equinum CBS 127.97]|uniref:Coatomer subunit delta n=1 Tax=Trichophyton equinum (strain ATCC MYA-4606 / CBS 127.97) TaxID=559882 RepID=F2Q4X9_TRIEC|nr:coatomer subunit delta [Trichophyton equinum CBS 127.97]